jgi:membrane protein
MTDGKQEPGRLKRAWNIIKETFSEWQADKVPRLGAALAFYTVFSLAPLLIIVIAVVGFVLDEEAVRGQVSAEIEGLIGKEGASLVESMIRSASEPRSGIIASITALFTLFLGATGVFVQLQDALNTLWGVETPSTGFLAMLRSRFLSFVSVLGIGFLLLVSLLLNAVLTGVASFLGGWLDGIWIAKAAHFVVSFGGITVLFAMMYKLLPDTRIEWRDVWIGAAVTALLFTIGKFLIGFYLGRSGTASTYGAAGTTVVVLLWVYYAAQIFLLGAEFTHVYTTRCGSRCPVRPDAPGRAEEEAGQEDARAERAYPARR